MQASKRRNYLRAMGVDLWVPRAGSAQTAPEDGEQPRLQPTLAETSAGSGSERGATTLTSPPPVIAEPAPQTVLPVRTPPVAVPADWAGLRAAVKDCMRCKLCATRTRTVFGVGPESAPLMVVGEGPGADEDAQGEPFVGRAGKLLDEMLAAIGRSRRDNVFIANVVKCRPPGNRDPEADEVEACRPYLDQQIRLVQPRLIVGLGRIAAQRLLATDAPLSKLRGPLHRYGDGDIPLFITYHPAYLLRSPREKAKSWDDLKKIWRYLRDHP